MPDGALYFEQTYWPFLDGEEDLNAIPQAFGESMWTAIASPPGPVAEEDLARGAEELKASTDRAVIGLFGGNLLECGQFLYRIDGFHMMLAGEPAKGHAFLDRLVEIHLDNLGKLLIALSLIWTYINIMEIFTGWFSGSSFEYESMKFRMFGFYGPLYWEMLLFCALVPLLMLFGKIRKNWRYMFILSILINIGTKQIRAYI